MQSIREAFGKCLEELGNDEEKLVLVSCDLKVATKADYFFQRFPERSFEVGIAEANAIGIAAGLGLAGYKPVLSSFGAFLSGKNVEIRTSIAYNDAPVVLVGTHGGLIGPDGATQSGIQDISVMRSIPRMKVFQPSTPILTKKIIKHCIQLNGPCYVRVARNEVPEIYDDNLEFVEGDVIGEVNEDDVVLISSGPMLHNSIYASTLLKEEHGINVSCIDVPSFNPFNSENFLKKIEKAKYLFSVEDHMIQGGLGSLIAESLSSSDVRTKLYIKGLDQFVGSGKPVDLEKKYLLDSFSIVDFVLSNLK